MSCNVYSDAKALKRESGENPEQPALLCDGQPSGYATREKGKAEALDEIESGDLLYMSMIFFGGERTAFTLDFSHRFLTYKMKKDRKYAL